MAKNLISTCFEALWSGEPIFLQGHVPLIRIALNIYVCVYLECLLCISCSRVLLMSLHNTTELTKVNCSIPYNAYTASTHRYPVMHRDFNILRCKYRGSTMTATNNVHNGHNYDSHKLWWPTWWNLSNDVKWA